MDWERQACSENRAAAYREDRGFSLTFRTKRCPHSHPAAPYPNTLGQNYSPGTAPLLLRTGGHRKCSRGNPNNRHLALNATSTKGYGISAALEHDIKSASTIRHTSFKIHKGQGFLDHKNIHKEDKKLKLAGWDTRRCTSPGPLWKDSTQTDQLKHTPTPLLLLSSSYSPLLCAFSPPTESQNF